MKYLLALGCTLLTLTACASSRITASITVTNSTTNGVTFAVNGSTRTFTNNVVTSSSQVLTNSDATGCGSKTNLFNQIALNPFAGLALIDTGSNTFQLAGTCGGSLLVTLSTGYATTNMSAQTCAAATPVGVPFGAYYPNLNSRTNTGSELASDLNSYSTTALDENAPLASELVGTNNTQTITGQKTLSNTNNQIFGVLSSMSISGTSRYLSNGVYFTPIFSSPAMTNAVNYGAAFSSHGTNTGSEQYGSGAAANGSSSIALGFAAEADNFGAISIGGLTLANTPGAIALGLSAQATATNSTALGAQAAAQGLSSSAIGFQASATADYSTTLGFGASSTYTNSTAVGALSATTADNQVMLGAPGISAVVQNNLTVQTNLTVGGNATIGGNASITGNFSIAGTQSNAFVTGSVTLSNADLAFPRKAITSLANGNNAAVPIGTNAFIEVSGPSGSFTINGMSNGRDGKEITILNQTGFQMTIANESGTDPTAENRIRTLGAAADLIFTNAACTFIYNANVSRWILIAHNP